MTKVSEQIRFIKHHIESKCENYKAYLGVKNFPSLNALLVSRLQDIAHQFILTEWDILRLVMLIEKVHILKGTFQAKTLQDTSPDNMLRGVYDVTDIRQILDQTFTTIEHLAAVVKISGNCDQTKLDAMLIAIFGNNNRVERLKRFSKLVQFKPQVSDAKKISEMFKSLSKNFMPVFQSTLNLPEISAEVKYAKDVALHF